MLKYKALFMSCFIRLAHLQWVWEPSVSVAASVVCRLSSVVCLSRVRSPKLRKILAKFRHPYRKSGSPSKNMTSHFALEVASNPKIVQNSVRAYCLALLSDAACWRYVALMVVQYSTLASGVIGVVVVVVCNRSQIRTSKCTCLIFGVSIGLDPG